MSDIELGKRIKERREHLKLSQEQLAKKMGYKDKSAISKIESGQRDLNQAKIQKSTEYCHALSYTVIYCRFLSCIAMSRCGFSDFFSQIFSQ